MYVGGYDIRGNRNNINWKGQRHESLGLGNSFARERGHSLFLGFPQGPANDYDSFRNYSKGIKVNLANDRNILYDPVGHKRDKLETRTPQQG